MPAYGQSTPNKVLPLDAGLKKSNEKLLNCSLIQKILMPNVLYTVRNAKQAYKNSHQVTNTLNPPYSQRQETAIARTSSRCDDDLNMAK